MTDPKLWSDADSDAGSLARDLLAAGRSQCMTAADRRSGLARLMSAVPAGALSPPAAPTPAATPSLFATPLAKSLVVCSGMAVLGAAGLLASHARTASSTGKHAVPGATATARALEGATAKLEGAPAETPTTPELRSAPLPSPAGVGVAPLVPRAGAESRLREESLLVLDVRRILRAGDAAGALARLAEADAKFPHGGLGQEREALLIEALFASGKTDLAKRRAEAFLRAFPKSPYAESVRNIARR